jgi:hypothetical protein
MHVMIKTCVTARTFAGPSWMRMSDASTGPSASHAMINSTHRITSSQVVTSVMPVPSTPFACMLSCSEASWSLADSCRNEKLALSLIAQVMRVFNSASACRALRLTGSFLPHRSLQPHRRTSPSQPLSLQQPLPVPVERCDAMRRRWGRS